ncbi:deubiquitinase OTUD6B-like [Ostrea edulis]|uniref:deubiquitinase OTUD6B-like n=1 Tax=Ostrea edulis TaxID=37623 RepID=UPI002094BDA5|nr:deubiquitinase OTUD6B-like [Ostrea edulis]XP_048748226.1 deubiquitinase OTUD6B-like [Ostrea edulis]XP_048748229.1 deubiquitinase OTUD6B-like [Ostrea edulis]XP_048748237.1 deubiquitinase OTUD6B-like [Ostrea edulis]XP_048748241.1 deubiquitinase OTUD6B-like [Ostrea edulis]
MDITDTQEDLLQRHKQEKKELLSQITKLKHSISKGDKKGKKAVQEQISQLEKDLQERHDREVREAEEQQASLKIESDNKEQTTGLDNKISGMVEDLNLENSDQETSHQESKKISKAQKRRNKKAEADKKRQEEIAQQEIENETGARNMEFQKLRDLLKEQELQIFEITSDGNCMYNAIAHQVNKVGRQTDCKQLRQQAANYMRENAEDFLPFLTTESGDIFTDSDFDKYCCDLETTTVWGGHLEIKALSHVLNQPIRVLQSDGPMVTQGEDCHGDPVTLVYHRHAFGLGEHYNSVEALQESVDT